MSITWTRFVVTFVVGFLVTSNLNWAVAELILNPWAIPAFEGFMRGSEAGGGANIAKMVFGFMLPLLVAAILMATLARPSHWAVRALWAGFLVSLASFYGTYTFISGWGQVPWWPLMVTATCDMAAVLVGVLLIGYLQNRGRRNA
jgi:hypothetical protein